MGLARSQVTYDMKHHFLINCLSVSVVLGVLTSCQSLNRESDSTARATYGAKVKYDRGQIIEFPDFTIEFLGEKPARSYEKYSRHEFRITKGPETKDVSWGRDEGDIGRVKFLLGGDNFLMELIGSQKYGVLGEKVLVIWKNPDESRGF